MLENGVGITPVATLKDEWGGVAHIWVDDGCYQLGLERMVPVTHNGRTHISDKTVIVKPVTHIFPEAFEVMKTLPPLSSIN